METTTERRQEPRRLTDDVHGKLEQLVTEIALLKAKQHMFEEKMAMAEYTIARLREDRKLFFAQLPASAK